MNLLLSMFIGFILQSHLMIMQMAFFYRVCYNE